MRMLPLLCCLAPLACAPAEPRPMAAPAAAPAAATQVATPVRPGVEVLATRPPAVLAGKRVGLVTNHTGQDRQGRSTIDLLHDASGFELVALYGPEHGLRGVAAAGEKVASGRDQRTGLPIHSLYGETQKPTPAMLQGVDALVFDIQDIGARQYTYISTMALAMQAAAEKGIPFVVLDRPNPIGGEIVEGNLLDPRLQSFVGIHRIPVRHGMTVGELARLFNEQMRIGADLTVVKAEGWRRGMWQSETGLPWVNPSPNIRRLEAAIHYPGTVFLETVNLSEGRGTDRPFEQTGAPWLRAAEVADSMNAMGLPGVRFEAIRMPVEQSAAKYGGQTIPGVRLLLTDRESYRPVRTTLLLIDLVRRLHPADFRWVGADRQSSGPLWIERIGGTDRLRKAVEEGWLPRLLTEWERDEAEFRKAREPYLLY